MITNDSIITGLPERMVWRLTPADNHKSYRNDSDRDEYWTLDIEAGGQLYCVRGRVLAPGDYIEATFIDGVVNIFANAALIHQDIRRV